MTRGDWSQPRGLWGAIAEQAVLQCYRWEQAGGEFVAAGFHEERIDDLVGASRGDPLAFVVLDMLANVITTRGDAAPRSLAMWMDMRRRGEIAQPKRRGQAPWTNAERDQTIYERITELKRGRRRGSKPSPWEIVAREMGMTAKAVEQRWDLYTKPANMDRHVWSKARVCVGPRPKARV